MSFVPQCQPSVDFVVASVSAHWSSCLILAPLVQPAVPELAVGLEPPVELRERLGGDRVHAGVGLLAYRHQTRLAQHPQVL